MNEYQPQTEVQPSAQPLNAIVAGSSETFEEELHFSDDPLSDLNAIKESAKSVPIVQLVDRILGKALDRHVLELHLEPQESSLLVRYRQDNSLMPLCDPLSGKLSSAVIARIKLIAGLDIGQRQIPQKGRVKKNYKGRAVHFIVRTLPSFHGEKTVIRILDNAQPLAKLEQLIAHPPTLKQIKALLGRPSGLFLVAGGNRYETAPLLYALLLSQARQRSSLATVEDPIIRVLEGVTQIEVDEENGMTCSAAMQVLASQVSDVVSIDRLTGEIVAQQAVDLALQGRMVIASLPSQNPTSAIAHLRRWVDPQQLADALIGAIGQYPMRKLCPSCRLVDSPNVKVLSDLCLTPSQTRGATFYRANALSEGEIAQHNLTERTCPHCNGNGFLGYVHTFDTIGVTPRIRSAIAQGVDVATLLNITQQEGATSCLAYSLDLAKRGETSLGELMRFFSESLKCNLGGTAQIVPTRIQEKLQALETYLLALGEEVKNLKAELQAEGVQPAADPSLLASAIAALPSPALPSPAPPSPAPPSPAPPEISARFQPESARAEDPAPDIPAGDENLYEELLDPVGWDELKKEFVPGEKAISGKFSRSIEPLEPDSDRGFEPTNSIADPWS